MNLGHLIFRYNPYFTGFKSTKAIQLKDSQMNKKTCILLSVIIGGMLLIPSFSFAAKSTFTITIKDHQFSPKELVIPANEKVKLIIENLDPTAEEFESYDLNREKIVTGNGEIILFIGPLKPGEYKYFGEFHEDTAQGIIIADIMTEKK